MTTRIGPSEPTEEMVEAVAEAIYGRDPNVWQRNTETVGAYNARCAALRAIAAYDAATPAPAPHDEGHPHLIDGEFQSDKYPTCPRGKVPLSVKDKTAQDLLWEYAQRRRAVDAEFAADLEIALTAKGYIHSKCTACGGNDGDAPCLYPSENKAGCLRDARLSRTGEKGERIPSGWRLVPVEPTEKMLTTGSTARYYAGDKLGHETTRDVWSTMLAASPPPAKAADPIRDAAAAFLAKVEELGPKIDGVIHLASMRGGKWPADANWIKEMAALRAALAKEGTP